MEHTLAQFVQKFLFFVQNISRMDSLFEASFSPLTASGTISLPQTWPCPLKASAKTCRHRCKLCPKSMCCRRHTIDGTPRRHLPARFRRCLYFAPTSGTATRRSCMRNRCPASTLTTAQSPKRITGCSADQFARQPHPLVLLVRRLTASLQQSHVCAPRPQTHTAISHRHNNTPLLACRQALLPVWQVPAVHEVHLGAAAAPLLPDVRGDLRAAAGRRRQAALRLDLPPRRLRARHVHDGRPRRQALPALPAVLQQPALRGRGRRKRCAACCVLCAVCGLCVWFTCL